MKLSVALSFLALGGSSAFMPVPMARSSGSTARSAFIDPHAMDAFSQQMQQLPDVLSSFTIADEVVDAVAETAKNNNGWLGFLTGPIAGLLQLIHESLVSVGLSEGAWGLSIIAITLLIKAATFPITKTQLESSTKMQALQPKIKEIQATYQSNPEVMNQKMAEFYQANDLNPLAGCLPSLAQIPIFIGLYRAVLELAKENKLDESFLWMPSLEGPTYGADATSGSDWILKGWVDGAPSLGWHDTTAFLVLPALLVVSQFASMQLMQPKADDPNQQQANAILKFLPLMIGWFSLNVPAALHVYWLINNLVTTSITLFIRNSLKTEDTVMPAGSSTAAAATTTTAPPPPFFSPPRDKPAGFGDSTPLQVVDTEGIKTITPVDAEILDSDVEEVETVDAGKKRGGSKKKRKKRKN